jgi:hypothetical protein
VLGTITVEHGALSMETATLVDNEHITNWDSGGTVSAEYSTIAVDVTAGEVTIGEAGLYSISVNTVGAPVSGNNVEFYIGYQADPGGTGTWGADIPLGTAFITSQTGAIGLGGWDFAQLNVGDKLRFTIGASNGTSVYDTDFIVVDVKIVLPDSTAGTRGIPPTPNSNLHFRGDT